MLEPPAPSTWRITLPRSATAVPIARAMVRTAMQDLRATADRTTAQLLTAELVANALKHTCDTDPIELVVELRSAGCRIEVHDSDPLLVRGLGGPLPLPALDAPVSVGTPTGPAPFCAADGPGRADGPHAADGYPTGEGHLPMQRTEHGGQAGHHDETDSTGTDSTGTDGTEPVGTDAAGHHEEGHAEGHDEADDADGADDADINGNGNVYVAAEGDAKAVADRDSDAKAPAEADAGEDHDRGRGLLLIRFLSSASGCRPTPRGKAVWFTLPELRRSRRS